MASSSSDSGKRVVLGQLGKVHGVRGWLKLHSYTSPPENILDYSPLLAGTGDSEQLLEIDQTSRRANGLLVHFKGIDDATVARSLTGLELSVASAELPALEEGNYYWHELEGMEVCNGSGQILGRVLRLLETGANDVLVVGPSAASVDDRERLIPYLVDSVVEEVDRVNRRIRVDWPADYLE